MDTPFLMGIMAYFSFSCVLYCNIEHTFFAFKEVFEPWEINAPPPYYLRWRR